MNRPSSPRTWSALIVGIVAGYAVLIGVLSMQDDWIMVAALALSLGGVLLALRELRRRRCVARPADPHGER